MTIPRYILHPFLLLVSGGILLGLVWTGFEVPSTDKPASRLPLPNPSRMARITDVKATGLIQLDSDNSLWWLWDERFRNMTDEQTARVNALFAGKLVLLPTTDDNSVRLPIELYDPLCFKGAPPRDAACPVVIEP